MFHTVRPAPGDSVVVYGVGTVGLSAVMAAALSPATTIVAVDTRRDRLDLATELGATSTVDATMEDPVARVHEICRGPATAALECTGVISVVRQAVDSVGTCVLIGGAPAGAQITLDHLSSLWGKRVLGTLGGSGRSHTLIPALLDLQTQGRFPFDRLATFFDFADLDAAIDAAHRGTAIKPILRMPAS